MSLSQLTRTSVWFWGVNDCPNGDINVIRERAKMDLLINGHSCTCLLNMGSKVSTINMSLVCMLGLKLSLQKVLMAEVLGGH